MKHYKEEDGPGVWDNFDWDSHSWAAVVLLQRCVESKSASDTSQTQAIRHKLCEADTVSSVAQF
jgi:hypothetical protein